MENDYAYKYSTCDKISNMILFFRFFQSFYSPLKTLYTHHLINFKAILKSFTKHQRILESIAGSLLYFFENFKEPQGTTSS